MNHSKEFILIIVILANVTIIYNQENMGFFPGPFAYFGSPRVPLSYYQKANTMTAAKAIVNGPVRGTVSFYQPHGNSPVFITGKLTALGAGKYDLFITEYGDSGQSCTMVGPIWDIRYGNANFGWPFDKPLGDLGSVVSCNDSTAAADILSSHNFISLTPGHPANILGRGLAISTVSGDTTGGASATIVACGPIFVIQPIQTDNYMETPVKVEK